MHLREEDKTNAKKLLDLSSEHLIQMANAARPNLVRLMQSALRYDADIKPQEFDPSDPASVITVALTWKLDSTNRALQNSLSGFQNVENTANADPIPTGDEPQPEVLQNNSQPRNDISPLPANPFAIDNPGPSPVNLLNPLTVSNILQQSNNQKRPYDRITLISQQHPKQVRFCNLADINSAQQRTVSNLTTQDFRGGGSPTDRLPPHLMGEYTGRQNSKQVLRVFEYKGAETLAGLLQEGVTVEMPVRNRSWKRSFSGDPFQSERGAINLARIFHLTLMVFPTVEDALKMASWLETCLRRLHAILYVESHCDLAPRATLWKVVESVLETTASSSLQVPSMEKAMAQHATLLSKERTALTLLSRADGRQPNNIAPNSNKNSNKATSKAN